MRDTLATVQTELQLQSASLSDVQTAVAANSKVSYELSHRVERNTAAQDLLKKLAGQINQNTATTQVHSSITNADIVLHAYLNVLIMHTSLLVQAVV